MKNKCDLTTLKPIRHGFGPKRPGGDITWLKQTRLCLAQEQRVSRHLNICSLVLKFNVSHTQIKNQGYSCLSIEKCSPPKLFFFCKVRFACLQERLALITVLISLCGTNKFP